jgi:hypothetical protein
MEELFKEIPDTSLTCKLAQQIGELQTEIEVITFNHFMDLKQLCGKDQQDKLHTLLDEFYRRNRPPGPDRPKDAGEHRPPLRHPPHQPPNR